MKRLAACLLVAWIGASGYGEQPGLEAVLERMKVEFVLPEGARRVPPPEQGDVDCQLAFRFPHREYEVRCSFFPADEIAVHAGGQPVDDYVPLFTAMVLMCIARDTFYFGRMAELPAQSVAKEFGADHGLTALLPGDRSEFSRGYRYVVVNSLYRKGSGIVNVYFLYDDARELDMDSYDYFRAYYCFTFRD